VDDQGEGLVRAIRAALASAGVAPAAVGMIVAHGNGTVNSDVSEARALVQVFGDAMPPVTAFKWAFGHLLAAAGLIESVLAVAAMRDGVVPGLAGLGEVDAACAGLDVAPVPRKPSSDVVLIVSRGFGGTNAACVLRVAPA
jgi:3-oxoacyl-(acyl-carrier-protein) synthase